ncbi:hypothetical protein SK128_008328, partial [Halocaridina rubra]
AARFYASLRPNAGVTHSQNSRPDSYDRVPTESSLNPWRSGRFFSRQVHSCACRKCVIRPRKHSYGS